MHTFMKVYRSPAHQA